MGQAKLCHHSPPSTTTYHQPKYIHHHPPLSTNSQNISPLPTTAHHHPSAPTTSQNISTATYHFPKNGPPPNKSQNIFIYNLLLTLLWQCLFVRNVIFLSVTEILWDKVLISSFFKFQISTTFRSSHRRCSVRIGILRNCAKFTGKKPDKLTEQNKWNWTE